MGPHPPKPLEFVIQSQTSLVILAVVIGLVALITRRRPMPDLASRVPERSIALRETGLWILLRNPACGRAIHRPALFWGGHCDALELLPTLGSRPRPKLLREGASQRNRIL